MPSSGQATEMSGRIRLLLILSAAAFVLVGGLASVVLAAWPIGEPERLGMIDGDPYRGAYLARAGGCISCHTDFGKGGAALAGGAPLDTPFGSFVPPNITPDPVHGIGDWTMDQFAVAVRQGIGPDGRPYYPAFTYQFYADFSDQDIADLWAAIRTVPAVAEPAPEHDVSFPFNLRFGLKLWRGLFLEEKSLTPVLGRSDAWNRGQQLVTGAAHCAACHTGRNLLGGLKDSETFAGNDSLPGGSVAPSIRAEDLAATGWTVDNMAYALRTGMMPNGDAFGGSMAEVVQYGTVYLDEEDRRAIATYLLSPEGEGTNGMAAANEG